MWNFIHSAVQGQRHLLSQTPCQDKTFVLSCHGGRAIALGDGAGSAKLSHAAASCLAQAICHHLLEHFDDYWMLDNLAAIKQSIIHQMNEDLIQLREFLHCEARDLLSTLLAVAVKDNRYIAIHIGDGVMGCVKHGELCVISHPSNGEFINTTVFVNSPKAMETAFICKGNTQGVSAFILMSDGMADGFYQRDSRTLSPALLKLVSQSILISPDEMQQRLDQNMEAVVRHATQDDCSICMMFDDGGYKGYQSLACEQRARLLGFPHLSLRVRRRFKKLDSLIHATLENKSLTLMARQLHCKERYLKRHLSHLECLGYIYHEHAKYKCLLKSTSDEID